MFEAEALGLSVMYETRTIHVPRPFKVWKFWTLYRGNSLQVIKSYFDVNTESIIIEPDLFLSIVGWAPTHRWFLHHHGIYWIWCI